MQQRLSLLTLATTDLPKARAFYKALGWQEHASSNADVAFFQLNGFVFGIWSREKLAEDAGLSNTAPGFGGFALAHNVESQEVVDATLKEAEAAGATIRKWGEETFWGGYSGYFTDLDGHPWEIAWNPGWTLHADGSVSL